MSKGLEALKELRKQSETHGWLEQQFEKEWLNAIEKELKALDNMRLLLLSYEVDSNEKLEKQLKKHEQYKEIEQELGIDLVTLFKALKQGHIWVKENGLIEKNHGFCINETGIWSQVKLDPNEYGLTWALTKEELK